MVQDQGGCEADCHGQDGSGDRVDDTGDGGTPVTEALELEREIVKDAAIVLQPDKVGPKDIAEFLQPDIVEANPDGKDGREEDQAKDDEDGG
jgi:hypothetical protein